VTRSPTQRLGDAGEDLALTYLERAGLSLVARQVAGRFGEIDLIMRAPDGTTVFVEVRRRASTRHGGAGASISGTKQRRIIFAARHYLLSWRQLPPARFDVVTLEGQGLQWLQGQWWN
jgi:putative endonuclease